LWIDPRVSPPMSKWSRPSRHRHRRARRRTPGARSTFQGHLDVGLRSDHLRRWTAFDAEADVWGGRPACFPGWLFAQHPSSGVSVLVLWFGAEGQAYGCDHPGGGEVAQVCAGPREPPDGAVASVGYVEVAILVEDQTGGCVQPSGGEVTQIMSGRRELPNRVATKVG